MSPVCYTSMLTNWLLFAGEAGSGDGSGTQIQLLLSETDVLHVRGGVIVRYIKSLLT